MKNAGRVAAAAIVGLVIAVVAFYGLALCTWTIIHNDWWHAHSWLFILVLFLVPTVPGVVGAVMTCRAIRST